jgi:hypothetical protein
MVRTMSPAGHSFVARLLLAVVGTQVAVGLVLLIIGDSIVSVFVAPLPVTVLVALLVFVSEWLRVQRAARR